MISWTTVFGGRPRPRPSRAHRFSRGQTAIIFALAAPLMVGALALGVDVGLMYFNWMELQKAADAAVLAGANSLPGNPSGAITTADAWVTNNGAQSQEITSTTVASDDLSMTISLQRTVPYNFGQVLGLTSQQISVTATAGVKQNPAGVSGLIPIGLPCDTAVENTGDCTYTQGTVYTLKNGQLGPGNWAPLELGNTPGANSYRTYMSNGYTGTIPQTVPTETGNVVGPTGQAIDQRLAKGQAMDAGGTAGTCSDHQSYDPRLVAVPLIEYNDPNGKKPVTIVGYASMWVESLSGNNNAINLCFVGWISQPTSSDSFTSFGLNSPVLQQ